MTPPTPKKEKVRTSITLDPALNDWITQEVKSRRFRDRTHAIEYALSELKKADKK